MFRLRYLFSSFVIVSLVISPIFSSIVLADGYVWQEVQPAGDGEKSWINGAVSDDGQTIVVGVSVGRLYLSTNGGTSWAETQPAGSTNKSWRILSMSYDGQVIIAGVYNGRLYLSTNGGSSWGEVQPAGDLNKNWRAISLSNNGQMIIAGVSAGRLYLSTNGGTSWAETQPAGNVDEDWDNSAMSLNGQVIIIGSNYWETGGRLYLSTNGGTSWAETQPAGNVDKSWYDSSVSNDGQVILAVAALGRLYLSTNGGTSWAETQPAGNVDEDWAIGLVSGDYQTLITGAYPGRLYLGTWNTTPTLSNLGPTTLVDGSTTNDATPTLTFTTTDGEDNTVAYELQVSTDADFSTLAYHATSTYATPGAISTTTASLPDASYYWRVLVGDGNATSTYTTANNGEIAFIIDTYVPPTITPTTISGSRRLPRVIPVSPTTAVLGLSPRALLIAQIETQLQLLIAELRKMIEDRK